MIIKQSLAPLKVIIMAICVIVLLNLAMMGLPHSPSLRGVLRAPQATNPTNPAFKKGNSIVILLQKSVVDPSHQMDRLKGIDKSWANWAAQEEIPVFAAVEDSLLKEHGAISMIRSLDTEGAGLPPGDMPKGFGRFVNALLRIMTGQPASWYLIANDHSFIVPQNLAYFLRNATTDADAMVYSGTKLGLQYKGKPLVFASGGAGLILSHTSIKALLVVWSIEGLEGPRRFCDSSSRATQRPSAEPLPAHLSVDLRSTEEGTVLGEGLCSIAGWWKQHGATKEMDSGASTSLTVALSAKWTLQLTPETMTITPVSTVSPLKAPMTQSSGTIAVPELRACVAKDRWENENPGIVVAHCLQRILPAVFMSTRSEDEGERFNVYGPLRSVTGDTDEWYRRAKDAAHDSPPRDTDEVPLIGSIVAPRVHDWPPYRIAKDAIGFHYVSQVEAGLLYHFISAAAHGTPPTSHEIQHAWPTHSAEAGHYARPLRDTTEAAALGRLVSAVGAHLRLGKNYDSSDRKN